MSTIHIEIKFFASCRDITNINSYKMELNGTIEEPATVLVVINKVLE